MGRPVGGKNLGVVNFRIVQDPVDGLVRERRQHGVSEHLKGLGSGLLRFGNHDLARRGRDGTKEDGGRMAAGGEHPFLVALPIPRRANGLVVADVRFVLEDYDLRVGGVFLAWRVPPERRLDAPNPPGPTRTWAASN